MYGKWGAARHLSRPRNDRALTFSALEASSNTCRESGVRFSWVVAMEATGGECQRGGFSGREREWDDSHTLTPHLWTPTSALRPAWLAIAVSVETCHENLSTGVSWENFAKPHDIRHQ